MKSILRCVLVTLALVTPALNLGSREIPIVAGTLIQCTIDEPNFSSHTATVGDPLICYARPLSELGCTALPAGSELSGRFTDYKDPGRLLGKGWLQLQFDRLILPDGEAAVNARLISARGFKVDSGGRILGKGHAKRDAAEWAIPVLWPIKLVTLPRRGPRPTLKGERVITLRLLDDVRVPCRSVNNGWFQSEFRPFDSSGADESEVSSTRESFNGDSSSEASADNADQPKNPSGWTKFSAKPSPRVRVASQRTDSDAHKAPAFDVGHHTVMVLTSASARPSDTPHPPAVTGD